MEVLSSRVLLRPSDLPRSRSFYGDTLGLAVFREFGTGEDRGTVFFLGGGFLEVSRGPSSRPAERPGSSVRLWLQVRSVDDAHAELQAKGVEILRPPVTEPWGLREMWIADPDGLAIAVIEVPEDHPMRRRP